MAAITVRELLVKIGVEADKDTLDRFDKGLGTVKAGMADAAKGAAQLTGIMVGVGAAMLGVTITTAAAGDSARKTAQSVSVTTEEYQELAFAAKIAADATDQELNVALKTQARNAEAASRGTGEAVEVYKMLGVEVKDASGKLKGQVQLLEETAEAFKTGAAAGRETAFAQKIFGESGTKLIPLLSKGSAGIRELRNEAQSLGLVMSDEAAKAGEDFNDTMTELGAIATGLRNTLGSALLPIFTQMAEATRDWFISNREMIQLRLEDWASRVADGIERIGRVLRSVDRFVRSTIGTWEPIIVGVGLAIGSLALGIPVFTVMTGAVKLLTGAVILLHAALVPLATLIGVPVAGVVAALTGLLAPLAVWFGIVAAAVGVVVLIVDELLTFMRGGETVIGSFTETLTGMGGVWKEIADVLIAAAKAGGEILLTFKTMANIVGILVAELPAFVGWLIETNIIFLEMLGSLIRMSPFLDAQLTVLQAIASISFGALTAGFTSILNLAERWVKLAGSGAANFNAVFGGATSLSDLQEGAPRLGEANRASQSFGGQSFAPAGRSLAAASVSSGGNTSTVQQTNQITIDGAANPEAVGEAVVAAQERQLRAARDSFAGGER